MGRVHRSNQDDSGSDFRQAVIIISVTIQLFDLLLNVIVVPIIDSKWNHSNNSPQKLQEIQPEIRI